MAYTLNQLNQKRIEKSDLSTEEGRKQDLYLELIPTGFALTKADITDNGSNRVFYNECVCLNEKNATSLKFFNSKITYYFHGKIKRLENDVQVFDVFLVKYDESGATGEKAKTQFIKNFTVASVADNNNKWYDIDFMFTPLIDEFDCILFKLSRESADYSGRQRHSTIFYEELSIIKNRIPDEKYLKIGVQSKPGLKMCINKEEIHIGRSGIYELKNGVITINFFSVVNPAEENVEHDTLILNEKVYHDLDAFLEALYNLELKEPEDERVDNDTVSYCAFGTDKLRTTEAFTLDYLQR